MYRFKRALIADSDRESEVDVVVIGLPLRWTGSRTANPVAEPITLDCGVYRYCAGREHLIGTITPRSWNASGPGRDVMSVGIAGGRTYTSSRKSAANHPCWPRPVRTGYQMTWLPFARRAALAVVVARLPVA